MKRLFFLSLSLVASCQLLATGVNAQTPVYPLKAGPTNRYLVDQNNQPFLIMGDSPHAFMGRLSLTDAGTYLAGRHQAGINALWTELFCSDYSSICPGYTTLDGIAPFGLTNPNNPKSFDLSQPVEAYFTRVDAMINLAAQNGITLFLDPTETGGWMSIFEQNGTTKAKNFGKYLGNRYKNFPNLVWLHGNDFQTWENSTDHALILAVSQGIYETDPNHLQTLELEYNNCDSSSGYGSDSLDDSGWVTNDQPPKPILTLNSAYTYCSVYDRMLKAYNRANFLPVYLLEAVYEYQGYQGGYSGPHELRAQEYWSQLSGGAGQLYGNANLYPFPGGWQTSDWQTSPGITQFALETNFFKTYPWYNLVPDQNHTVVTAGYGSYDSTAGFGNTSNYVTTARTPDGTLVMSYIPVKSAQTNPTVDLTKLAGPVTARWFDPTTAVYTTINGSPFANTGSHQFTPPGNNAGGDSDWVLVLTAGATGPTPTPTIIPTPTASPSSSPTPSPTPIPGDFNHDSSVDYRDWLLFIPNFNQASPLFSLLHTPLVTIFDLNKLISSLFR